MFICAYLLCICDLTVFVCICILRLNLRMISHGNKKALLPVNEVATGLPWLSSA